jgi:SAM-dependent methyltransferase
MKSEIQLQWEYYTKTAKRYDDMHLQPDGGHDFACALISSLASHYDFKSVLDVGSGTGRALSYLSTHLKAANLLGIEPVEALREIGHKKGIPKQILISGDAMKLDLPDNSFDLVMELGVLHHVSKPRLVISEMLRVARKAIFISDANRFGQGIVIARYLKYVLWKLGLWGAVNTLKTKGRNYGISEGDGIYYSYSVFDDYDFIGTKCSKIVTFNLEGSGRCSILGANHVGLFALKN